MANEFVTRTGLIVSGSTYLPAATSASKGHILSFDASTKEVYYMSTSSVTVTVPGSDTQVIYNNGGAFGASSNFVFSGSNVGIGTSSPSTSLQVNGTARATRLNSTGGIVDFDAQTGNNFIQITSSIVSIANGGNVNMTITSAGNVGIGTTSPFVYNPTGTAKGIEVGNSGSAGIRFTDFKSINQYFDISVSGSEAYIGAYYSTLNVINIDSYGATRFKISSNDVAAITSVGVGIGKTNPTSKLDVSGSVLISGSLTVSGSSTFTNIGPAVFTGSITQNASTASFGGVVGIGTTSPSYKLDVQGDIGVGVAGATTVHTYYNSTTRNQIVYTNNSSFEFHEGTNERIRISAGGNVGIGTSTPDIYSFGGGKLLTVSDTSTYSVLVLASGGNNSGGISMGNQTIRRAAIDHLSGSDLAFYTNGTNSGTTVSERMRITSAGNVGIGITNPSARLHISESSGNAINVSRTGGYASLYGSNDLVFETDSVFYFGVYTPRLFSVNGNFYVSAGGLTSIGKSSANATLDVTGSVLISGSLTVSGSSTFTNIGPAVFTGSITQNASTASFGGLVGIGTTSPARKLDVNGTSVFRDFTSVFAGSGNIVSNITWLSTDSGLLNVYSGGSPTVQLNSNGVSYFNGGNVGIGTTNPNSGSLQIYKAADTNQLVLNGGSSYPNVYAGNFLGSLYLSTNYYYSGGHVSDNASLRSMEINMTTDEILFATMPAGSPGTRTRLMTISGSQGFIGIGTSSPSEVLEVVGNVRANVSNGGGFMLTGASASGLVRAGATGLALRTNTTDRLTIDNSGAATFSAGVTATSFTGSFSGSVSAPGSTTQIVYNSGGALAADSGLVYSGSRVGIGNATPDAKLTIVSTTAGSEGLRVDGESGGFAFVVKAGSTYTSHIRAGATIGANYFTTPPSNGLIVEGNVGIGTTSPNAKLDVVGSAGIRVNEDGIGTKVISIRSDFAGVDPAINVSTNNALLLQTNNTERMRITSGGNVGIGLTNPSTKLQVSGSISLNTATDGTSRYYTYPDANHSWYYDSDIIGSSADVMTYYENFLLRHQDTTNVFLIDGSGNVCIGTTSSFSTGGTSKLSILGSSVMLTMGASTSNLMYFRQIGTGEYQIQTNNGGNGGSIQLQPYGGNVGIGVTSPTYNLEVSGSGYISGSLTVAGTITAQKLVVQQVTSSVVYSSGSNIFGNSLSNTQTFTGSIQATGSSHYFLGNVGIGTTNPTDSALEVNGNIGYTGDTNRYFFFPDIYQGTGSLTLQAGFGSALAGGAIQIFGHNTPTNSGSVAIGLSNVGDFKVQNYLGDSTKFIVKSTGNVGIGTTSPSSLLNIVSATQNSSALVVQDDARKVKIGRDQIEVTDLSDGASTMYLQPNSNLVINSTSGNVGIGTQPSAKLHVSANGIVQRLESIASYTQLDFYNTSYGSTNSRNWAIGSNLYNYGDLNIIASATSASAPNTAYTYFTINKDGNVGIGTVAPTEKLDVTGIIASSRTTYGGPSDAGGFRFKAQDYGGIYNDAGIGIESSGGPMWFNNCNGGGFYWNDGTGGERMRLTAAGNLGIGTTNPDRSLLVSGSIGAFVANGQGTVAITVGEGSNVDGNIISLETDSTANTTRIYNNGTGTTLNIGSTGASADVSLSSRQHLYFNVNNGGDVFGGTTAMFVSSSGNVGIGTTSPTGKLHVADDGPNALVLGSSQVSTIGETNDGGYPGMKIVPYNSNIHIGISSTNDNKVNLWHGGSNYTYWQQLSTYSVISNYSTNALALQIHGGSVGIGTTSPGAKLDVSGNIRTSTYYNFNGNPSNPSDTTAALYDQSGVGPTLSGLNVTFRAGTTPAEVMRVASNGNVGIATDSPGTKLEVTGNIYANNVGGNAFTINSAGSNYGFILNNSSNTFSLGYGTSLGTVGTSVLTWNSSGNVGIGNTNPSAKLDISAGTNLNLGVQQLSLNNFSNDGIGITFSRTSSDDDLAALGVADSDKLGLFSRSGIIFATSGSSTYSATSEAMRIAENGNVGIGTTSPAGKLHVLTPSADGSPGLIVSSSGWGAIGTPMVVFDGGPSGDGDVFKVKGLGGRSDAKLFQVEGASGSTAMLVRGDGRVGINTASPSYTLTVGKQEASDNADYALAVLRHGTGVSPGSWTSQPAILISDQTNNGPGTVDTTGLFSMQLGRFDYTDTDATNASLISITYDGTVGPLRVDGKGNMWVGYDRGSVPTNSGAFGLLVRGGASIGSNYQATTPPSNGAIIEGNVGIGTTSPGVKLDVVNNGSVISRVKSTAASGSVTLTLNPEGAGAGSVGDGVIFYDMNSTAWAVGVDKSENSTFKIANDVYGNFSTNNYFNITTGGNVGIGTTSPTQRLHVSGAIAIEAESTTTKYSTTFSGSLTTNTNIASVPTGSFKAAFFDYYVASGSVNMRAGTVMSVHNNSTSRYTDTSTGDIGDTSAVDFSTSIVAGSLVLTANVSSGTWEVKTSYRAL